MSKTISNVLPVLDGLSSSTVSLITAVDNLIYSIYTVSTYSESEQKTIVTNKIIKYDSDGANLEDVHTFSFDLDTQWYVVSINYDTASECFYGLANTLTNKNFRVFKVTKAGVYTLLWSADNNAYDMMSSNEIFAQYGGYLYFLVSMAESTDLFKVKTDGSDVAAVAGVDTLNQLVHACAFTVNNGVYFYAWCNNEDSRALYNVSNDTISKIADFIGTYEYVTDSVVYNNRFYVSFDFNVISFNLLDGSDYVNEITLAGDFSGIYNLVVYNNQVIFIAADYNNAGFIFDLDGNTVDSITNGSFNTLTVLNDYLYSYYTDYDLNYNDYLYRNNFQQDTENVIDTVNEVLAVPGHQGIVWSLTCNIFYTNGVVKSGTMLFDPDAASILTPRIDGDDILDIKYSQSLRTFFGLFGTVPVVATPANINFMTWRFSATTTGARIDTISANFESSNVYYNDISIIQTLKLDNSFNALISMIIN